MGGVCVCVFATQTNYFLPVTRNKNVFIKRSRICRTPLSSSRPHKPLEDLRTKTHADPRCPLEDHQRCQIFNSKIKKGLWDLKVSVNLEHIMKSTCEVQLNLQQNQQQKHGLKG